MPSGRRSRVGLLTGSRKANHPSLYSDVEELSPPMFIVAGCSGSKKSTPSLVAGTTVRAIQKSNPAQNGVRGASGSSGYDSEKQGALTSTVHTHTHYT